MPWEAIASYLEAGSQHVKHGCPSHLAHTCFWELRGGAALTCCLALSYTPAPRLEPIEGIRTSPSQRCTYKYMEAGPGSQDKVLAFVSGRVVQVVLHGVQSVECFGIVFCFRGKDGVLS